MGFGSGIGDLAGGMLAHDDIEGAQNAVNGIAGSFNSATTPYNTFGQSFLSPATNTINTAVTKAGDTMGYDDFMKNYTLSPGAQYQMGVADTQQNNTAAAKGGLLSGANLRQLKTIDNGIVAGDRNTAYNEYLAGNNQQFGQLESALGNMFSAIGVGTTATGQQAGVANSQMTNTTALSAQTAAADKGKGSGIGSILGGFSLPGF